MANVSVKPRFLLAKYVPDISRMEPRNIGVFLWSKGEIRAKFLEREQVQFVNEPKTFERWKTYWRKIIEGAEIRPLRGKPVLKSDPACMDALLTTQEGNYILVDAGDMFQAIPKRDIDKATEFLFRELVVPPKTEKAEAGITLKIQCDKILESTGLKSRKDFRPRYPVSLALYGHKHPIHFSFGFGNGTPKSLFQRVLLSNELSVNNAAMTLHEVSDRLVERERCAALVQKSSINTKAAQSGLDWLSRICPVIDVDSPEASSEMLNIVQNESRAPLSSRSTPHTEAADRPPEA